MAFWKATTRAHQPVLWNSTRGGCHAFTDTDVARDVHCGSRPGPSCGSGECSAREGGCRPRLECECRRGRARRLLSAQEQPAPRIAALCRHAFGHPRRAERDRPSLSSVRLEDWSETRSLSRCCSGCGGARRAGPTPPATSCALLGLRRRERGGRGCRCGLCSRAWGNPGRSSQAAGCCPGTGRCRGHPCPKGRGRVGHTIVRHGIPTGDAAWRVPLHTWVRLRVRAGMGRCHPLCAAATARSSARVRRTG